MNLQSMLLLLAMVMCYTLQGALSKVFSIHYQGPALAATPVFASISGSICALATLWLTRFAYSPSNFTLWMGIANGVVLFLYNVAAVNAARTGPYSLQSLIATLGNILLPLLASILLWQEKLGLLHYAGIAIMLLAAAMFNIRGLRAQNAEKGYAGWVIMLMVANGLFGILMSSQQRIMVFTQRTDMIITTYATSSMISALFLLVTQGWKTPDAYRMGKVSALALLVSSIGTATAVNLMMQALRLISTPVLYTITNGGVLVMAVLLGSVVWKEKFTANKAIGLVLAVTAFILLGQAM